MASIKDLPHEERLRLFSAQAKQYAIVILDLNGNIVDWPIGAQNLMGWTADETIGQPAALFFTPEDRVARAPEQEIETALKMGEAPDVRWHMRKDGSRFFVDGVLCALHDAQGNIIGFGKILRDLTGRKELSDYLWEQASLLDLAYDPAFSWEFESNCILYWNKGAEELYGYSAAEMLGSSPYAKLWTVFPENIKETLISAGVWSGELLHTSKDGRQIHIESRMVLHKNLGARPVVLESNRNITSRKQATSELEARETRFRSLVTATAQVVWHVQANGEFIEHSPTWQAFTGQTCEQMKGFGWLDALHPDDPPRIFPAWKRSIDEGKIYECEYRLRRADGQYRWTAVRAVPVKNPDGSIREWVGINTDIHDQKQSREQAQQNTDRLMLATQAAQLGIWTWNPDTDLATWDNDRMYEIFGISKSETPLNAKQFYAECIHPDDIPIVQNALAVAIQTGNPFKYEIRIYRRSDRQLCWLEATGVCQPRTENKSMHIIGTLADITQRKLAEQRQSELATELESANRRQGEFLATLAHELRNPLAPIKTGLDLMRLSGDQPESISRTRVMMERQVDHLVHLVNDLLDIARINTGKIELHKSRTQLKDSVLRAVEISLPSIQAKQHDFSVDMPDEAIWLTADDHRLTQIISNLLTNAAKYTPSGGKVALSVRRIDGQAEIVVADNGIGIPEEAQPHIFNMFTQVGLGRDHAQGGLGIGLNLVKRLTEKHGGTVSVKSAGAGHGAVFTVVIPVEEGGKEIQADHQPDEKGILTTGALRILVADDNRDAADMLQHLLEALGHVVRTVPDGIQALEAAKRMRPDVALLDIGMPGLNGHEVAREIRKQPKLRHIALAALTGWGTAEDQLQSRQAGFDFHLTKPISLAGLTELIASVAERKAMFLQRNEK